MEDHFRHHPLAHSVLGTKQSITALTRDQMQTYFDARYGPGNMVLAVAGKMDFDELVRLSEQKCGGWKHLDVQRQYPKAEFKGGLRHIVDSKLKRHYVAMICPGPSAQHDGRYAAQVLSDVIGDHDGSRLYWALVEPGLADEADFSFYPHDGAGSFFAYASCDPERSGQVAEILRGELLKVSRLGLTDAEIGRSKNKIATSTVLQGELPLGRMRSICSRWIYNQDYKTLEDDLRLLQAVDAHEIQKVIKEFPFAPLTTTTLGPGA